MRVSYSRASSYLRCPQQHFFNYVKGLQSKKPVRPLTFGGDFHKLLENRRKKSTLRTAFDEIKEAYYNLHPSFQSELGDDYLDDLRTIINDYRKVWKGKPEPDETEHEFNVMIGKFHGEPIYFNGFIDEVYHDERTLGEHKTFSVVPDMGILAMNMQSSLYSKAWELEKGVKLERVRWDYIKSKPAAYPVWLPKSNRFSDANNQNITPYSWLRACKQRGITDKAILEKANNYSQNITNFFFRCDIEFVPEMVDTVWQDFKLVVRDIAVKGKDNKVKNITKDCGWCSYRPLCYAEFTGADLNYIIKTDYIIKERG